MSLRDHHGNPRRAGSPLGTLHSLRTCNWLADGIPSHEVQPMAGLADLTTIMSYYSKVSTDARVRVREATERSVKAVVA